MSCRMVLTMVWHPRWALGESGVNMAIDDEKNKGKQAEPRKKSFWLNKKTCKTRRTPYFTAIFSTSSRSCPSTVNLSNISHKMRAKGLKECVSNTWNCLSSKCVLSKWPRYSKSLTSQSKSLWNWLGLDRAILWWHHQRDPLYPADRAGYWLGGLGL